jgi:hypothetical protein
MGVDSLYCRELRVAWGGRNTVLSRSPHHPDHFCYIMQYNTAIQEGTIVVYGEPN